MKFAATDILKTCNSYCMLHCCFLVDYKLTYACYSTSIEVEVEVLVNLRPTVNRPVCLGVRPPSGARDQFFILLEISFRQLRVWYFVAPSLTRGRVCNLRYNCFWALPEQWLLCRSPAELTAIFYCLIWDSPNLEGQVPVFISSRNRVAQLYPRALVSLFVASYDLQGYGGGLLSSTRVMGTLTEIKRQPQIYKVLCKRKSPVALVRERTILT
jgi:hypothetical protein